MSWDGSSSYWKDNEQIWTSYFKLYDEKQKQFSLIRFCYNAISTADCRMSASCSARNMAEYDSNIFQNVIVLYVATEESQKFWKVYSAGVLYATYDGCDIKSSSYDHWQMAAPSNTYSDLPKHLIIDIIYLSQLSVITIIKSFNYHQYYHQSP
jgi:hypothetical protein